MKDVKWLNVVLSDSIERAYNAKCEVVYLVDNGLITTEQAKLVQMKIDSFSRGMEVAKDLLQGVIECDNGATKDA